MKVTITSTEIIKPSSQSIQHLKPYKLCLFDQFQSLRYATCVLFYPNIISPNSNFTTISKTLTHLKKSLSETLNLYYPFSGRLKGDMSYVHDFDAGIPFMETRVDCRMAEYFKFGHCELLNKLLPFPPCRQEVNEPIPIPLVAFQANIFSCGGLALGVSLCHKFADGASLFYLYSSWAALSRGSHDEVIKPNFSDIETIFPLLNDFPEKYSAFSNHTNKEGNYVTKRFLFSAKAVENLRDKARIREDLPKPTRNEAISCFIWKHVTKASWAVSGSRKAIAIAHHMVNIRGKLKFQNPVGNLLWCATAVANTEQGTPGSMELPKLVGQLREAMEEYESVFCSIAEHGYKEGFGSELILKKVENLLSLSEQLDMKPDQHLWFTNWKGFFNDIDFGWGKPFKIGVYGKVDSAYSNTVFLVDSQWGKGIEATVILEEKLMAVLERDVNFLTFASTNPGISSL